MNISSSKFSSIELMHDKLQQDSSKVKAKTGAEQLSFASILHSTKVEHTQIKFSKHANERLVSRNIELTKEQVEKLRLGTSKAKEKGINESLVIVDGMSFIVSCKNNTVITAVDDKEEHIFTNIDGAVIM